MARIKRGIVSHAKHKKIMVANKGYRMTKRRLISVAKEAYLHAGEYAFAGRKNRKRDMRQLWITRINSGLQQTDLSYSQFIYNLKKAEVNLNRKMLAQIALDDPETFKIIINKTKN